MKGEMPSAEWGLDRLADYARKQVRRIKMAPRRVARDVFLMGAALVVVRDRLKADGEYDRWLAENKLPKTTAYHAVRIFDHFKTSEALGKLTITKAKQAAGLVKPKSEGKPSPAWLPSGAPRVVVKLAADIDAVRGALAELDSMDKAAVAKLAEELADLAKQVAGLAKPAKTKRPHPVAD